MRYQPISSNTGLFLSGNGFSSAVKAVAKDNNRYTVYDVKVTHKGYEWRTKDGYIIISNTGELVFIRQ